MSTYLATMRYGYGVPPRRKRDIVGSKMVIGGAIAFIIGAYVVYRTAFEFEYDAPLPRTPEISYNAAHAVAQNFWATEKASAQIPLAGGDRDRGAQPQARRAHKQDNVDDLDLEDDFLDRDVEIDLLLPSIEGARVEKHPSQDARRETATGSVSKPERIDEQSVEGEKDSAKERARVRRPSRHPKAQEENGSEPPSREDPRNRRRRRGKSDQSEADDSDEEDKPKVGEERLLKSQARALYRTYCLEAMNGTTMNEFNHTVSLLLDFTVRQIQDSKLIMDPFPYIFTSRIFEPTFYYRCILPNLPRKKDTTRFLLKGSTASRYLLKLATKGVVKLEGTFKDASAIPTALLDKEFWEQFAALFSSSMLADVWVAKFKSILDFRNVDRYLRRGERCPLNDGTSWRGFHTSLAMVRDVQGHVDPPSTAGATTWVMAEYYLPEALDVGKHMGHVLLKSRRERRDPGIIHSDFGDPDMVTTRRLLFKPNSAFAFAPCEESWTGVRLLSQPEHDRDVFRSVVSHAPSDQKAECKLWAPSYELEAPPAAPARIARQVASSATGS